MPGKVAVVTGSNKGIGFGIVRALCKGFDGTVYLTARDESRGKDAVAELAKEGLSPKFHQLDIESLESIEKLGTYLKSNYGGLDVLVNNAAIAYKNNACEPFGEQAENTISINYFKTLDVCHELFPILKSGARVVHISSCEGHLHKIPATPEGLKLRQQFISPDLTEEKLGELMNAFVSAAKDGTHKSKGWPNSTYQVSKVGVSALTRIQQRNLDENRSGEDIVVNCVHPGWVDTDMSSHKGVLTIDQGAAAASWLALLPPKVSTPRGGYVWHDKTIVDWNGPTPSAY